MRMPLPQRVVMSLPLGDCPRHVCNDVCNDINGETVTVRGLISSLQLVHLLFPGSGQEMKGLQDDSQTDSLGRRTMELVLASPVGFPVYDTQTCTVHYTNRPYSLTNVGHTHTNKPKE